MESVINEPTIACKPQQTSEFMQTYDKF